MEQDTSRFSPRQKLELLHWYLANKRDLPWRKHHDPYRIWISETMLQQTTSTAVIPYFLKFIEVFPNLPSLAKARENQVLSLWSGLGYYSRARNLHRAARTLAALKAFPQTFDQLLELPGFGPYTARAVSSLAFDEPVGVLDGNVIRVLSRWTGRPWQWWQTAERNQLQALADQLVQGQKSAHINQAIMELGATTCLPKTPRCSFCPWLKSCQAYAQDSWPRLPVKKPRKKLEIWIWQVHVIKKNRQVALVRNTYAPFLKGQWILPGTAQKARKKPRDFDFRHSITHHEIYVQVCSSRISVSKHGKKWTWVSPHKLGETSPTSLVRKALAQHEKDTP